MVESRGTRVRVVGRLGRGSISLGHAESIGSGGLPWACAGLGQWGARSQWRGGWLNWIGMEWLFHSHAQTQTEAGLDPSPGLSQD
jgi:hypothetical protein